MLDISNDSDTLEWGPSTYRTILATDDTDGAMSIVDSVTQDGEGPPRHVHDDADETFVVLSGQCEFWLNGRTFIRGPGETAFVPRGQEHTFRVVGGKPSRHLVILTPGGFEHFFAEMAAGQFRIPQDMDKIAASAARHHLRFTGLPLAADAEGAS